MRQSSDPDAPIAVSPRERSRAGGRIFMGLSACSGLSISQQLGAQLMAKTVTAKDHPLARLRPGSKPPKPPVVPKAKASKSKAKRKRGKK
jgi:hypothetical protein